MKYLRVVCFSIWVVAISFFMGRRYQLHEDIEVVRSTIDQTATELIKRGCTCPPQK